MGTIEINSFTINEKWDEITVDSLKNETRFNYSIDVSLNGRKIDIKSTLLLSLSSIINANHNMKSYFHNVIHPDGFGNTSGLKVLFIKETSKEAVRAVVLDFLKQNLKR